jgi:hypothetical protein
MGFATLDSSDRDDENNIALAKLASSDQDDKDNVALPSLDLSSLLLGPIQVTRKAATKTNNAESQAHPVRPLIASRKPPIRPT